MWTEKLDLKKQIQLYFEKYKIAIIIVINIEIYMYKNFNSKHYLTTLLALIFSVCFSAQSNESSVVIEGHYQGKNIYQSPNKIIRLHSYLNRA